MEARDPPRPWAACLWDIGHEDPEGLLRCRSLGGQHRRSQDSALELFCACLTQVDTTKPLEVRKRGHRSRRQPAVINESLSTYLSEQFPRCSLWHEAQRTACKFKLWENISW